MNACDPAIVVVEYNALWGLDRAVSIPYSPDFVRFVAHPSGLYAGASVKAMVDLGRRKGYRFVGTNSQANNAFFVKSDLAGELPEAPLTPAMGRPGFRQARNASGRLTFEGDERAARRIADMPLVDLETGILTKVAGVLPPANA
jgi:hypothetical protein